MMEVRSDLSKLEAFAKALKIKHRVQVGVFSGDANRFAAGNKKKAGGHVKSKAEDQANDNAFLGAVHELGQGHHPPRSFLRATLFEHGQEIAKIAGKDIFALAWKGQISLFWKRLGIACEKLVDKAFQTGGFGKWPALKAGTIRAKGSSAILIDTGQLRRSIASRVI